MDGRLHTTLHSLRARSALAVVALLAFLATSALPRRAWYVHEHGADAPGHVHAGAAGHASLAGADDEWSRLLEESVAHRHRHGAGHRHDDGDEPRSNLTARAADAAPAFAPAASSAHAHWQAPFQPTAQSFVAALDACAVVLAAPVARAGDPQAVSSLALRARAPPRLRTV